MKAHHRILLSDSNGESGLALFAFLNLGLVQSLHSGALSPSEAIQRFYHADNCLYVRKHFQSREANIVMSRGVQLPDLFESLPLKKLSANFCTSWKRYAGCVCSFWSAKDLLLCKLGLKFCQ